MFKKLFSIEECFRLSSSHINLRLLGIKFSFTKDSLIGQMLYPFRNPIDKGSNNKVFLINKNGIKKEVKKRKFKSLQIYFRGNNNIVTINEPIKLFRTDINIEGNDCNCIIEKNASGKMQLLVYGKKASCKIGENTTIADMQIVLMDNEIEIGSDCMISNNVKVITDTHSVIDINTNKVLNKPTNKIIIGNHVWIGQGATLTKNAQIPSNCIVATSSVVSKKFEKENCILGGIPAKIIKENITWNPLPPNKYEK